MHNSGLVFTHLLFSVLVMMSILIGVTDVVEYLLINLACSLC